MRSSRSSQLLTSRGLWPLLPTYVMELHYSRFFHSCEFLLHPSYLSWLIESDARRDAEYFRQSTRPSAQPSENWVLRFSALKRLYRLMTQYFAEVLHQPTHGLDVPDLQSIAKDHNITATLIMCRLTIVIAVQCEKNKEIIEKIQRLSEWEQHSLMRAIEQVSIFLQAAWR